MKILWICFVWPEPRSSAAGFRTLQLIEGLCQTGHQVQICSPCQPNQHQEELTLKGFITKHLAPNDNAFDSYVSDYQPEIVFFDRFIIEEQFSWRVRENCPSAMRVLDSIDLHSLRRARQRQVGSDFIAGDLSPSNLYCDDTIREISAIYRSDLCLLVSDFELNFLQDKYSVPKNLLELCRFSYPSPKALESFDKRNNFIVIGNFNHAPNLDSFMLMHEKIWPEINAKLKALGQKGVEIHIYGAYPKNEILALDNKTMGFRVKGWAEDARQTLSTYRVNLAPLRFGAGIKGKVADGWYVGTPCIATSIAAEGMHAPLDFAGAVADDLELFVERAVEFYCKEEIWQQAQEKAVTIIDQLFSYEKNEGHFIGKLEEYYSNLDATRRHNFIGHLLWYQKHRSTEFFSRWIEEKNRGKI